LFFAIFLQSLLFLIKNFFQKKQTLQKNALSSCKSQKKIKRDKALYQNSDIPKFSVQKDVSTILILPFLILPFLI
jgi:hypothetical protein